MKKIDTSFDSSVLGRPFLSRSLDHIQEAYTEIVDSVIKGLLGSYTTNDIIVLYGCVISGTPGPGAITMTAGAIYYNGEVYLVSAASFVTSGADIPLWTIATTYQTGDPIMFSDNVTTHNVSKIIKFVLVGGPAGGSGVSGYVANYNAATIKTIKGRLFTDDTWTTVTPYLNSWAAYTTGGASSLKYRKDESGWLYLRGSIDGTAATTSIVFTLPAGYRPAVRTDIAISSLAGATSPSCLIVTSGNIVVNPFGGVNDIFSINAAIYLGS